MSVSWDYYDKFDKIIDMYLPAYGEGTTKGSQVVTALNKLIYKWYNDGDVFDNTGMLNGWANDLSSYANWLYKYVPRSRSILDTVFECEDDDYEDLLKDLADLLFDLEDIEKLNEEDSIGSIYDCDGPFKYEEPEEDEEDDYEEDDYEEDEEGEDW